MILLAEKSMVLEQSKEVIFSYLTNMENYGAWFPGVVSIQSANDLPHGTIGKKYREALILPEGETSLVIEVKESKENQKFYTEGDLDPLFLAMLMEFNSITPAKTNFSLKYFSRNPDIDPEGQMVAVLKQNLSERIEVAEHNLVERFHSRECYIDAPLERC